MEYHNPVLLKESVDGLNIKPDGVYVDVTFGGGGHSREILKRLGEHGKLFAFDQDTDALQNKIEDPRFTLINENFRFLKRFLRFYGVKKVDGILGDFGVSSHQFNEAERGFSTRFNAKLDMRMDQSNSLSAYQVINEYDEEQLKSLFYQYADLKNAPKLARIIVSERKNKPIENSEDLNELLKPHLFKGKENKILAQIYQAIRIEVNQEIEVLKEFLLQTEDLVEKNGRISLISYHSLEDRLVKRYIRSGLFEGEPEKDFYGNISVPFKKVGGLIVPSKQEISENNRARSAKLRIAKKL
ncbi:16S rRNA (cytosine(1402)-N(4))-methyltransferase RsmH [Zunongwangia profunda]|uniref:Ribosomal RNA small subunit methyltransferase H n=2 Tax=Zunongwangia profunda TaxID=398743 RepID=D5BLJ5_ZUNPS|nr:16S rRNA (cytosine(1402)-N(4))-methyltransferase RsmH [Zunongwangia profunda]MAG88953.1 16S rRNA (cytosine(1402)-N(4))-methyltransferase RsmH [Flavobacteriaceae bacterium]MAS72317.1 16S rRNA (cytosine(1402)-N(4))-methyltransferase RsmH [Zunongwangia sp.]ADF54121.1 S-adenosyl-methyltransferase MraW [Zunongwangia profunda SM-A87]HAJ81565.1 16S rRNA (cytosine(1402)-N(4))-methyltransferase RsmH [Zunongwangia profunda]HCV80182.1 16S rRNA (cytosine(1402)-N(4))-methyltransferase RsmH [Zunongwangia|tara:strand:+ start:3085 stop:3981 length:897 start_codon:yes stop_codon:yes gene_type:complete